MTFADISMAPEFLYTRPRSGHHNTFAIVAVNANIHTRLEIAKTRRKY